MAGKGKNHGAYRLMNVSRESAFFRYVHCDGVQTVALFFCVVVILHGVFLDIHILRIVVGFVLTATVCSICIFSASLLVFS